MKQTSTVIDAGSAKACDEIDWLTWVPKDVATLTFVLRPTSTKTAGASDEILLIRKKRGLGAGKINGPGGRVEGDETLLQCAIREVQEELKVTAIEPELRGRLYFQFTGGYSLECHVFSTRRYSGNATETDEAIPLWTPIDAIPFDEMWADDHHWFPHLLAERPFTGRFIFDDDTMLDMDLTVDPPEA